MKLLDSTETIMTNEPLGTLTDGVAEAHARPMSEEFKSYVLKTYPSFAAHAQSGRQGLTLFAGGTGSGKSSAMHLAAQLLGEQGDQLALVKDELHGGVATGSLIGGLEAAKRRMPSVVGMDEVRNGEEARVIMELVATGHPVWVCIHASAADHAVKRFELFLTHPNFYSTEEGRAFAEDYGDQMREQVKWLEASGQLTVFFFDGQFKR